MLLDTLWLGFGCFAKSRVPEMLRRQLVDLSNAVIGSTECGRIEWPASMARVFTVELFYKGIIVGMCFFFLISQK